MAKLIQSNIWAMAFFGSDIVYIGAKHFNSFRSAVTKALVSKTRSTSTWNACSLLSKYVTDPFLYVLLRTLLTWKRLMMTDRGSHDIFRYVLLQASDDPVHAFGPASILCCYLKLVGWNILADGSISDHMERIFCLRDIPAAQLNHYAWDAWDKFLSDKIRQRKGLQLWPEIDALQTRRVPLPDDRRQHAILANLRCIGTLWGDQREKWTDNLDDHNLGCPLCDGDDSREHFPFECPGVADLRMQFNEVIQVAKTHHAHLCFVPVIHKHPKCRLLQLAQSQRVLPEPFTPCVSVCSNHEGLFFYTDGSCIFPEQGGRLSTWSIIQDCCDNDDMRRDVVRGYRATGISPTCFKTAQVGMTTGPQTINRAEFTALIQIVASTNRATIVSDSQWAIDTFEKVRVDPDPLVHAGTPNEDLVLQLCHLAMKKSLEPFALQKIAAHQEDKNATSDLALFAILGNREADRVAKAGTRKHISPIHEAAWEVGAWYERQSATLRDLQPFLALAEARRLDAFDAQFQSALSGEDRKSVV